jgi:7,8-dihydro-6-hydroxymethylpterin-pyrophosphokinase
VLEPLAEIAGEMVEPVSGMTMAELLADLAGGEVTGG